MSRSSERAVSGIVGAVPSDLRAPDCGSGGCGFNPRRSPDDSRNTEEWRAVEGFPGYQVSDFGGVRRGSRNLSQRPHPRGYVVVDLSRDGKAVTKTVHRLVAVAFLGDGQGRQVNHVNGVKTDNRAANLEWATPSENVRHALATGLATIARGGHGRFTAARPEGRLARYAKARRKLELQERLRRKAARAPETAALEWALRTFAGPMRAVRA